MSGRVTRQSLRLQSARSSSSSKILKTNSESANQSIDKDEGTLPPQFDNNEEDDAPEDVSFVKSKEVALENVRTVMAQVKAGKFEKKERRRKYHKQLKEQKRAKIARLEEARLPDHVLEKLKETKKCKPAPTVDVVDDVDADVDADGDADGDKDERLSEADKEMCEDDSSHDSDENEDFIPLEGTSTVKVITHKESSGLANSRDKALAFRQERLYNSGVKRESSKSMLAKKAKSSYIGDK